MKGIDYSITENVLVLQGCGNNSETFSNNSLPVYTVFALQIQHASSDIQGKPHELLELQFILPLPQKGQEITSWKN